MKRLRTDDWRRASQGRRSVSLPAFGTACICSVLAMVCGSVVYVNSAMAAAGHRFLADVSEVPPGTALAEPGAVAVDRASGSVFVADPDLGVVDVFSSTGAYETQFGEGALDAEGVAVDEASGDVYIAEPSEDVVDVFKPDGSGGYVLLSEWLGAGTPDGSFGEVVGVAVIEQRVGPARRRCVCRRCGEWRCLRVQAGARRCARNAGRRVCLAVQWG